jgi:hypothetical protein
MAHQRLEVLEGIERAINSAPQVLEAVSACADHDEAAGALSRPPFDFTEQQAYHVLDIQFGRATAGRREALRHEIDELRPLAADASPPPPREEDDFVPPPTDPPRFVRLIAGPDEEQEVEGDTIRVISVELFHNSFAVASHRSLEGDVAFSRDLWLHPDVTDNRGTDYFGWGGGGSGSSLGYRSYDAFFPAPPPDARILEVKFDDGLSFALSLSD